MTSANAGTSNDKTGWEAQSAESTRFPGEGQSAQGQSGPKARPKGVADGQRG